MSQLRFTISTDYRKDVEQQLKTAQRLGQVRKVKYLLAILAVMTGQHFEAVARTLRVTPPTVQEWLRLFLCYGVKGAPRRKSTGRPAKLSPARKAELARLIEAGPSAAGFSGACWRSPMVQQLIQDRFSVLYNVFYIAELLQSLGFSFQKAKFVSDHLDEVERRRWRTQTWPQILRLARAQGALLLFGDEASFPQWGTLSYTWARRGQQPTVKTSGKRHGYKVFGLLDYFTGRFFSQGWEGRLNSASYTTFLQHVLAQTTQAIVLIQDGARYHTSAETRRFFAAHAARLTVFQLPAYSPDYNPIEKLWKKIKEHETHLHYFATFAALTEKVEAALLQFANAPEAILALCSLPEELAKAA
ncbi:MAG: IS630 family transposase [Acidobacteriota bacterium]|jgi:transposase|nr:IS630 family transposase [Acidobacteriota bacterium]